MGITAITPQAISGLVGVIPTYGAANADGSTFANDGRTLFHAKVGAGGGSTLFTFTSNKYCTQGSLHNTTMTVAAGAEKIIGPFPPDRFNSSTGLVSVAYSAVTEVTVAAHQY